jgi:site-specific recombinase XerD
MTLQEALVAYQTYARAEGKSPKTVAWIVSSAGYFAEFLGPDQTDIAAITANDLRRFIIALRERPKFAHHPYNKPQTARLSVQSIETYCRAIKALFGFLKREGFIKNNVLAKVKMPRVPEAIIPTFSEKELTKLLSKPDRASSEGFRDYCLLLTLIDTGIRLSELANLKADDIDYEQNLLRVMGKGQRERFVPFGRRVAKALMKYQMKCRPEPVGTDNFWLRRDGQALSANRIQKLINKYGKRVGLDRCSTCLWLSPSGTNSSLFFNWAKGMSFRFAPAKSVDSTCFWPLFLSDISIPHSYLS